MPLIYLHLHHANLLLLGKTAILRWIDTKNAKVEVKEQNVFLKLPTTNREEPDTVNRILDTVF